MLSLSSARWCLGWQFFPRALHSLLPRSERCCFLAPCWFPRLVLALVFLNYFFHALCVTSQLYNIFLAYHLTIRLSVICTSARGYSLCISTSSKHDGPFGSNQPWMYGVLGGTLFGVRGLKHINSWKTKKHVFLTSKLVKKNYIFKIILRKSV